MNAEQQADWQYCLEYVRGHKAAGIYRGTLRAVDADLRDLRAQVVDLMAERDELRDVLRGVISQCARCDGAGNYYGSLGCPACGEARVILGRKENR